MVDVLEFPTQEARAFAFLERELRALLTARGADEALISYAIDALTSVYSEMAESSDYSFSVDLPPSIASADAARLQEQIAEGIDGLRAQQHRLLIKLAARLVLTEMRLFQHERSDNHEP